MIGPKGGPAADRMVPGSSRRDSACIPLPLPWLFTPIRLFTRSHMCGSVMNRPRHSRLPDSGAVASHPAGGLSGEGRRRLGLPQRSKSCHGVSGAWKRYVKQKDSMTDVDLPAFIRALDRGNGQRNEGKSGGDPGPWLRWLHLQATRARRAGEDNAGVPGRGNWADTSNTDSGQRPSRATNRR